MRRSKVLAPLAIGLLIGCGGPADESGFTVRDSAGVRIVESESPVWTTAWRVSADPVVAIGAREGEEAYEFTSVVGAQRLGDGRIVVADGSQELRFFDQDGNFVRASGGEGGGPGEFRSMTQFTRLAHDTLLAFEMFELKASVFDDNGEFIRTFQMDQPEESVRLAPVGQFASGDFLMAPGAFALGRDDGPPRVEREQQSVYRYGPEGGELQILGPFPGRELRIAKAFRGSGFTQGSREFGAYTTFKASGNQFIVGDNATYELKLYSPTGVLEAIYRRHHDPVPVTDEELAALRAPSLARRDEEGRRELERYYRDLPAPPETMPAFGYQILVDRADNLWVLDYERPSEAQQRRWSVFDPDGRWLGIVRLPNGFDLMDAGEDWVLGRVRDELDVEYVQLYELIKGP